MTYPFLSPPPQKKKMTYPFLSPPKNNNNTQQQTHTHTHTHTHTRTFVKQSVVGRIPQNTTATGEAIEGIRTKITVRVTVNSPSSL